MGGGLGTGVGGATIFDGRGRGEQGHRGRNGGLFPLRGWNQGGREGHGNGLALQSPIDQIHGLGGQQHQRGEKRNPSITGHGY